MSDILTIYALGEQVYCLSRDFKALRPEVDWAGISGRRHRLAHDYEGTNWEIVSSIIMDDLPVFLEQVGSLLGKATETG